MAKYVYKCRVIDTPDIYEISLHRTFKGAYRAGNQHLNNEHNYYYKSRAVIGKGRGDFRLHGMRFVIVKEEILE